MKKTIYILFSLLFILSNGFSQGSLSVESSAEPDHILIGDVIKYSVIVKRDENVEVLMPSPAENLGMFEIRAYNVLDPQKVDGQIVEQTDYSISTFDTGDYVIPQLEINYRILGDSSWQVIKTEPIDIVVESLNPDEAGDIRDIKHPMTPPKEYRLYIMLIIFGILILAAILFVIYYIKRTREGKSIIPTRSTPPRPAHEIAFAELEKLKKSDLLANGKIKEYYTGVSDIVRQYIEGRYFVQAMEMTTTQLFSALHDQRLDETHRETIGAILMKSDLVKFAKFIPSAEEHKKVWQLSYDFIDQTKLAFEPEKEEIDIVEEDDDVIVEQLDDVEIQEEEKDV